MTCGMLARKCCALRHVSFVERPVAHAVHPPARALQTMETRDLKFEVMQNMFKKANSNHTNAIAKQRKEGRLDATSKQEARKSKDTGDKSVTAVARSEPTDVGEAR